ncbi:MAG: RsmB/NOP family class I SAM-dependent RNA methyltransferase [Bacteroidia bacterium]
MSRAKVRVLQASQALKSWEPGTPFSLHFKQLSRQNKAWGGRDRKEIQSLCYAWFRLGRACRQFPNAATAIPWAAFLFVPNRQDWIATWKESGELPSDLSIEGDFAFRLEQFRKHHAFEAPFFPETEELSEQIGAAGLDASLAIPARLWFRVKAAAQREFIAQLNKSSIPFEQDGLALSMEGGTSLDQLFGDRLASFGEVQDWASQQVVRSFDWNGLRVWDTCSGAGGKSLQITEEFAPAMLYCTDLRPAILQNLQLRFRKSGQRVPEVNVINLGINQPERNKLHFDALLCDVPCSGSGTFRRNPEGIQSVSKEEIARYAALQEKIVKNALSGLKKGGHLLYATCSVYRKENEDHLSRFVALGLELLKNEYVDGREKGGDILYYALFKKS